VLLKILRILLNHFTHGNFDVEIAAPSVGSISRVDCERRRQRGRHSSGGHPGSWHFDTWRGRWKVGYLPQNQMVTLLHCCYKILTY